LTFPGSKRKESTQFQRTLAVPMPKAEGERLEAAA
jgi:hypothetical protein